MWELEYRYRDPAMLRAAEGADRSGTRISRLRQLPRADFSYS